MICLIFIWFVEWSSTSSSSSSVRPGNPALAQFLWRRVCWRLLQKTARRNSHAASFNPSSPSVPNWNSEFLNLWFTICTNTEYSYQITFDHSRILEGCKNGGWWLVVSHFCFHCLLRLCLLSLIMSLSLFLGFVPLSYLHCRCLLPLLAFLSTWCLSSSSAKTQSTALEKDIWERGGTCENSSMVVLSWVSICTFVSCMTCGCYF